MARKYVILEASDVSSIDFDKVLETSADTLRWNLDNTKTSAGTLGTVDPNN